MKTEKKEKIYKAALNMIRKTGVHGLAMGQLSKDSGIAAGTFYHYFSSKDIMLQETFLYCHKRAAAVGAKVTKTEGTFEQRFAYLLSEWYEHYAKNTVELYFLQESEAGYSVTNNAIRESRVFYSEVFTFLSMGSANGYLRQMDPKLMLQVIYQNIFSFVKYEIIFETKFSESEREMLYSVIWCGLRNPETSV